MSVDSKQIVKDSKKAEYESEYAKDLAKVVEIHRAHTMQTAKEFADFPSIKTLLFRLDSDTKKTVAVSTNWFITSKEFTSDRLAKKWFNLLKADITKIERNNGNIHDDLTDKRGIEWMVILMPDFERL
jgi:hypothetical protein